MDPRWVVVARGIVVAALLAFFWRSYSELRPAVRARASDWALAAALGLAVFAAWITLDTGWMKLGGESAGFVPLDAAGRVDPLLVALRALQLALVVPVMEELFWRSWLLRWIDARDFLGVDPRHASRAAVAICSALFALEHSLWLAGLIAGIVYTLLYVRSGDVRVPILSHMVTNGALATWILATRSWHHW